MNAGKIQQLKHSTPKGDKKRKKELQIQIAQLEAELDQKHEAELEDLRNGLKTQVSHFICNFYLIFFLASVFLSGYIHVQFTLLI